ncbi:hypothetical protein [Glycomyces buryatensis]|uniref:Uncharacterized protein n=1 Tax=Glycomyces buryatensis TaxID=2570927 RepID=A0A4S8QEH9_9ACTN|nr:hypothetical protein [Glycomyces buryatensis]THV41315.1 hypothetical protein FAB82_12190 [Glycomyces buryatensis]
MGLADDAFEVPDPPPVLVPVPAKRVLDIHSARVVCGVPGVGWRFDLRADDPITRDGMMLVPLITEADYYRAVDGDGDAFASLVPADDVWVQQREPNPDPIIPPPGYLIDRLTDPDKPPIRGPVPASDSPVLIGRRVWYWTNEGYRDDFRCVSEPFEIDGDFCVRVVEEAAWYRWSRTGHLPKPHDAFIHHLWTQ